MKLTDSGRKVYSGGGIEPDKFIAGPVEGFNPTRFGRTLYSRQTLPTSPTSSRRRGTPA
jgi:hypothetical protein